MTRTQSRRTSVLVAALALVAGVSGAAVPAGANPPPGARSIPLPDDFSPEGLAVGSGSTFFVGSLLDGDIFRGDLRTGTGDVLVDAPAGRLAVGLKVDVPHGRLFVAGGPTGRAFVYDSRSGAPLADLELGPPGSSLINDVIVTHDAAYFTDSLNPAVYKVPIGRGGALGAPQTITLSGPAAELLDFPNLNGIEASADGRTLIVAHTQLGLFTVDPATGATEPIAIGGGALTPGTADGLVLDGRHLFVVENFANQVVDIRLDPDLAAGVIEDTVTNDDVGGLFRIPTTAGSKGDRLAVVNARFDQGIPPPLGTGVPPGTAYDVVVFDKP